MRVHTARHHAGFVAFAFFSLLRAVEFTLGDGS
jgi:hypothetical protein